MINIMHWILVCLILGFICFIVLLVMNMTTMKFDLFLKKTILTFIFTLIVSFLPAFIDVGYERITGIECTKDVEEINNKVRKCKGDINVIEDGVKEVIFKTETHERKTCFGFIKIMWDENYLVIPNKE